MKLTQNQAEATIGRIVTRIEEMDEYTPDMPVLFIGTFKNPDYLRKDNLDIAAKKIYDRNWGFVADWPITWWGFASSWSKLLYIYEGVNMNVVGEDSCKEILETEEYKNMSEYPEKDSIKIIDGTVVVKLYK